MPEALKVSPSLFGDHKHSTLLTRIALALMPMIIFIAKLTAAHASTFQTAACYDAAYLAAAETGVPVSVLKTITLVETGRKQTAALQPWPWTVNMEGTGVWFDTFEEAESYVQTHLSRGAESFDVGCFQINYKWHRQHFTSISEMFDPLPNARYAARFLLELHQEFGAWDAAAGAYHSRTPQHATTYKAKFRTLRRQFLAEDGVPIRLAHNRQLRTGPVAPTGHARDIVPRQNDFPLLQRNAGSTTLGSLAPISGALAATSLFSERSGQGLWK
ncbi:transglycosylase SLT domain-containing protein [Aliiroseovarius sp. CAU 1755]